MSVEVRLERFGKEVLNLKIVPQLVVSRLPETNVPASKSPAQQDAPLPQESFVPQQQQAAPQVEPQAQPAAPAASPAPASPAPAQEKTESGDDDWNIHQPGSPEKPKTRMPGDSGDDGPGLGGGYMRIASANCTALAIIAQPALGDLLMEGDGPSLGGGYFTGPTSPEPVSPPDYCEYPAQDFISADCSSSPAPATPVKK